MKNAVCFLVQVLTIISNKSIRILLMLYCLTFSAIVVSCSKDTEDVIDEIIEEDTIFEFIPGPVSTAIYFDSEKGNDEKDGLSSSTAWKSLDRINQIVWKPGSSILLKSGSHWKGQFDLEGSGSSTLPILMTSYDEGNKPIISGIGEAYAIKIKNQQYWEIKNLEITNYSETEEGISLLDWEDKNKNYWASGTNLPQYSVERNEKSAILIEAEDFGEINYLHFIDLDIHGVNGNIAKKNNGGIFFNIKGKSKPTWFNDILIEKCHIHDVDRTGISNISTWDTRSLNTNTNWTPSKKMIFRNNVFERTGANALIVRVAVAPLVEYNLFDHCAMKESGNASFPFNCDNALWQYNEARFTKYNKGDNDAGGFDSDYRCKNTTIRYNYSHDNEFGGVLICCSGGNDTRFNVGTQVCYNIFANNKHHVFRVSGIPDQTIIHNNVVYNADDASNVDMIWHKNWKGYASNTSYVNNIFFTRVNEFTTDLGKSTGNSFKNNIYWGKFAGYLPSSRIEVDPMFEITNYNGTPNEISFRVKDNSPAKDAGVLVENFPELDYFGNNAPYNSIMDIGIHEINK